jgi:SAM-dependent methyltransferase
MMTGLPTDRSRSDTSGGRLGFRFRFLQFMNYWQQFGPRAAFGGAKAVIFSPVYSYVDRRFDQNYGVDTVTSVPLKELTLIAHHFDSATDTRQYSGTPLAAFRAAMAALPTDLCSFTFVDFGAGKGRVLLLASRYRFRRVVGIEFSQELYEIARRNVAAYSSVVGPIAQIELVNDDATNFDVPNEPCILYFYNPFGEDVMSVVLEKITKSYQTRPRKLYFIYLSPRVRELFDDLDFLRVIKSGKFGALSGVVYESVI